jgi:hypothetical protein
MPKILVVEDTPKHLNDAQHIANQLVGVEVHFATNLQQTLELIDTLALDGVVSDVFIPNRDGEEATSWQNAVTISNRLNELRVHHVFNTDRNHHGKAILDFCNVTPVNIHKNEDGDEIGGFLTSGMLIESHPEDSNSLAATKQWQAAFRYVLLVYELLQLPDKGREVVTEGNFCPFTYGDYGKLTQKFERGWPDMNGGTIPLPQFAEDIFKKYNI